jgi:hypothetical protein
MALNQLGDRQVLSNSIDKNTDGTNNNIDTEKGSRFNRFGNGNARVGGRIAPVLPHLSGYDFTDSDSGSDILDKQLELEAGNSLQYRTCSWQKVRIFVLS